VTLPPDASGAGEPVSTRTALLPLTLDGERLRLRTAPPALGQDTQALLSQLGYTDDELRQLVSAGIVRCQNGQAGEPSAFGQSACRRLTPGHLAKNAVLRRPPCGQLDVQYCPQRQRRSEIRVQRERFAAGLIVG
jgi:hypothetical protein